MYKSLFIYLVLLIIIINFSGCHTGTQVLFRYEYSQIIMGSQANIILYASDEDIAITAAQDVYKRIRELDSVMSDYREDSELMQLCINNKDGLPGKVSCDLYDVIAKSQEFSKSTNGAFDITVGLLVKLWREAFRTDRLPDSAALETAMSLTGWEKLVVDDVAGSVQLTKPGMMLDLGGIGKGYAADAGMEVLYKHGIRNALIDLGGDIIFSEAPPEQPGGWKVGVYGLQDKESEMFLRLANCAIATSGDLERFVEIDGVRYSHIVDPRTGMGLMTPMAVTVIGPDAATVDALASAISVLGPVAGLECLAEKYPEYCASVVYKVKDSVGGSGEGGDGDYIVRRVNSKNFPVTSVIY